MVYFRQLLLLQRLQGLVAGLGVCPQRQCIFAKFALEESGELAGVVRSVVFGHHAAGHNAIFCDQVGYAREGAAVGQRILEKP